MEVHIRSLSHWTPRYIKDRLAVMMFERAHPDAPWLTADAISLLCTWLRPGDIGFEWGSGRSTAWFAKRIHRLISVEHDAGWGVRVTAMLQRAGVESKVEYHILDKASSNEAAAKYVRIIDTQAADSLDFVLVDGVSRAHCAIRSLGKLKSGGIIIVDNANWYLPPSRPSHSPGSRSRAEGAATATWGTFSELVGSWRHVWTSNGVTDTAFWVKP